MAHSQRKSLAFTSWTLVAVALAYFLQVTSAREAAGHGMVASIWLSQIGDEWFGVNASNAYAAATLVGAAAIFFAASLWTVLGHGKAKDPAVLPGSQTPERLKVFADWARQQIEETKPDMHLQILDDVIYTFATYAQRLERETSKDVRRAAMLRLRVLAELLETPSVNSALRWVNWAWLRDWDLGVLDPRAARMRCSMVLPTICAAERVHRTDSRIGARLTRWVPGSKGPMGPQSLAYLAAFSTDFLERPDVRSFLGLAADDMEEGQMRRSSSQALRERVTPLFASGPYSADSDSDDDEASPVGRGHSKAFGAVAIEEGDSSAEKFADFSRRVHEGEEHCWDDPDSTKSMVRGSNYLNDHKKVNSKGSMLELVDADLIKTHDEMVHYSTNARGKVSALRAAGDSRFFFVLNFRLVPIQLAVIWAVPKDPDWLSEPEGVLFQRFLEMSNEQRSTRLKVLPRVLEGPWLVKQGVPERPGVVGKKLACEYFMTQDHLEFSVNCISSPAGRRIVQLLTGAARHFSMQLSIVLEGQVQDELPERVLGGFSVYHGDLGKVPLR